MNTLAIESSSKYIIIYFNINGQIFSFTEDKSKLGNLTISLPNAFNEFILHHNISLRDLDLIINSAGPGSFTGLRISLSFVKGLAVGLSLPFVNIPTLNVFADSIDTKLDILAFNENISGRYYFSHYKDKKIVNGVKDLSEVELFSYIDKNIDRGIIVGNGIKKVFEAFSSKLDMLKTSNFGETLTKLGVQRYLEVKSENSILSSPFYVRLSDVESKLQKVN